MPVGGNSECVNSETWYASKGNFGIGLIPSMRMIVDLADFDKSVAVNSTGESGHPGSPLYGNQVIPWAKVQYHPLPWTRKQVDAGAAHKLTLNP